MDDASLLSSTGRVDSLEPSAHQLAHLELLGSGRKKGVGDVVGESLELLRGKDVSERGAVGHTTGDRA